MVEERKYEILVRPKSFLPIPTKIQSPQIEEKLGEKRGIKTLDIKCPPNNVSLIILFFPFSFSCFAMLRCFFFLFVHPFLILPFSSITSYSFYSSVLGRRYPMRQAHAPVSPKIFSCFGLLCSSLFFFFLIK